MSIRRTRMAAIPATSRSQRGFSLMEVMLAAVIAGAGLAGIAAMLVVSMTGVRDSGNQGLAAMLADSMIASLSVSPDRESAFARSEEAGWHALIGRTLPGGLGVVCRDSSPFDGSMADHACDGGSTLAVKVFWPDERENRDHRLVRVLP